MQKLMICMFLLSAWQLDIKSNVSQGVFFYFHEKNEIFKEAKVILKMILDQAVLSRKCYQANKGRSSSSHDVYNQDPVLLTVKALS